MPKYISKLLHKLQHPSPTKPQHSPHAHIPIKYVAKDKYVIDQPALSRVSEKEIKHVQRVIGSLIYYAREVDSTLLTSLSSIAAE